jgi:hypothetical protein
LSEVLVLGMIVKGSQLVRTLAGKTMGEGNAL